MERNCINELAKLLDEAGVPYTRNPIWGGEQIRIGALCDAVCHSFSYGNEDDLLEIMGAVTEEEAEDNSGVLGWLTPEEVAKRFIYCYKNNTNIYCEENKASDSYKKPESESKLEADVLEEIMSNVSLGLMF